MEKLKYNDNAAALTWEIINDYEDIGEWKLTYLIGSIDLKTANGNFKEFSGKGIIDFLDAASKLSNDMNVIFIKQQNWFIHIARKFIDFSEKKFFGNGAKNFYQAQLSDNVEMRGWDNFWDKIEDSKEFLTRLDICRQIFKEGCENKLGLEKHYKTTLAKSQWDDMKKQYYLYQSWAQNWCRELMPKDIEEYEDMISLNKASFYYSNPDYFGRVAYNLHSYDISSSHISFYYRKKFPYTSFIEAKGEEIKDIVSKDFYCWYGVFYFSNLHYKKDRANFKVDLGKFGSFIDSTDGEGVWELKLTSVDMKWFKRHFEWDNAYCDYIRYAQQKEIDKDYIKMIEDLYVRKDVQKKGTFAKEIFKFRAELPFGQSIKKVEYDTELVYNPETDEFEEIDIEEESSLKQIQYKLVSRGFPMYWGLWDVAYSRLEFYSMIEAIGFDKVIYGDTDSVKFIGDDGIKRIEERNAEIEKETEKIQKKRNMQILPKLGRWLDEGHIDAIKAIGVKWYATLANNEINVKASGANVSEIKTYLNNQNWGLYKFNKTMKVERMFKSITPSKTAKYGVDFNYYDKMDNDFKKEICGHGTILYDREEVKRIYEEGIRNGN